MKLQHLLMSAAVLTSVAGATFGQTIVNADSTTYTDATHVTSKGSIQFSEDNTPVNPVDPDNPDTPVDPVDPVNPNGAELMITYASNINFGTQSKSSKSWDAYADKVKDPADASKTKDIVPFISVKDSRGSDRKGWQLTAKLDGEFTNGKSTLKGASLKYSNLHFASATLAPTAATGVVELSKAAQKIAIADKDHGAGNNSLALGKLQEETETTYDKSGKKVENKVQKTSGITLSIPNGTAIDTGTYSTSVTYELTAGV